MNNTKILFCLFVIAFCLSAMSVKGNINLTIQSENERIITTTELNTFSIIATNSTNQNINLPYNNYILNIYPTSTKLNNTTFVNNFRFFNSDKYNIIWIAIIFMMIGLIYLAFRTYIIKRR